MLEASQYMTLKYTRVIIIKTAWYSHKNRQEDQWIRIHDPEINPHFYNQLVFDKGVQNTLCKKASSTNAAGKAGYPHAED
jgi:hypothetical protein